MLVIGPAPESCCAKGDIPEAIVFAGIPPGNGGRAPGRLLAGGGGGQSRSYSHPQTPHQ